MPKLRTQTQLERREKALAGTIAKKRVMCDMDKDTQLAKALNVTSQCVSNWRRHNYQIINVGKLLELMSILHFTAADAAEAFGLSDD